MRALMQDHPLTLPLLTMEEIPKTSVGKFSKRALRERFADHRLARATDVEGVR